jgi:hypothetical protein
MLHFNVLLSNPLRFYSAFVVMMTRRGEVLKFVS